MATYNARLIGTALGENIVNSLHVIATDGATAQGVAEDVRDAWASKILPLLSTAYSFSGCEVRALSNSDDVYFAGVTAAAAGTQGSGTLPSWACVSVQLFTGTQGRAGRGRIGLSPVSELVSQGANGNLIDPGVVPDYTAGITAFINDLASSGENNAMTLAVVSKINNGVERAVPLISSVTSFRVNTMLGSRLSRHPNR
jgi:hypothetical protein